MRSELVLGLIFAGMGLVGLLLPEIPIKLHAWSVEWLDRREYAPTRSTRVIYQIAGGAWLLLGFLLISLSLF